MGTIIIVVSFPNPNYLLKSGQFARVITDVGVAKETITVPQSCITQTQDIASLWIIRPDSTAEYRKVTLGDTIDNRIIITSGVEVGEEVAVGGGMKLRNGMKVIPVRSAAYE
jgi:multidrug efflux pump subunit AcrA (membrane-fusion protein)